MASPIRAAGRNFTMHPAVPNQSPNRNVNRNSSTLASLQHQPKRASSGIAPSSKMSPEATFNRSSSLFSPDPTANRNSLNAKYTSVQSMTGPERRYLLHDLNTVDIYVRPAPSTIFTLAAVAVSKMVLEVFSVRATDDICPRSAFSPSTRTYAPTRAFKFAGDERKDDATFVWEVIGVERESIETLVKYMINTCNPALQHTHSQTATIATRGLSCYAWMRLFQAAYHLQMGSAELKLQQQLNDDVQDCTFEDALWCWIYGRRLQVPPIVLSRFEAKVKGYIRKGQGLSLEQLKMLWGTDFDPEAQAQAARRAAKRGIWQWAEEDEWTLQELPEECWEIIDGVWKRELMARGYF